MIKHGEPPYLECSSRGDKRFSAFHARLAGKSIEQRYQEFKQVEEGDIHWLKKKGKKPLNPRECQEYYSRLWDEYINHNPELLPILKEASGLSDVFGQKGHVCQATELWRIRNEQRNRTN